MKQLTGLALALAIATPAMGEVPVRSGEHDTFTRLVLTLPQGLEWSVAEGDGSATLTLSDTTESFDTSAVFSRVPRTRLASFSETANGRLTMDLNCDCGVSAFEYGANSLVLDIADPEPGEDNTEDEEVSIAAVAPLSGSPLNLPLIPEQTTSASLPALGNTSFGRTEDTDAVAGALAAETMGEARTVLLREVGRAASQGLLKSPALEPRPTLTETTEATVESTPEARPEPAPTLTSNVNLRAESSFDNALRDVFARASQSSRRTCRPDGELDLANWAPGHGYQQDVGIYRRQLFTELDRVDQEMAIALTKLHLHFGFGAEAVATSNLISGTDADMLRSLGEILEYGATRGENSFAGQHMCEGPDALWAVMSQDPLEPTTEINAAAVIRAFDALPKALRNYLGPQLSERTRLAGHDQLSETIMRIVARGSTTTSVEAVMEMSQIDRDNGNFEDAESKLDLVVSADAPPSPEALVQLIDDKVARGELVDPGMATLASAYAFEFQGTEIGLELQRAYVLALADSGQFLEAIDALTNLPREFSDAQRRVTRSVVFDQVVRNAPDHIFLQGVIPNLAKPEFRIAPDTENKVAGRLLDLGITTLVEELLSEGSTGQNGRDRRVLRARLALEEDRPRNALAHLLALEGDDIDMLRAQAFDTLGEVDRAATIYARLEELEAQREASFLTRDWSQLQDVEEEAVSEFARARLDTNGLPTASASLAISQQALERSQESQERVRALLGAFEVTTLPAAAADN